MYGFIYITTNNINGKRYIGMCKNTHEKNYLGSGKVLKDAIKKYGKENFTREILQECQSFEELSRAEKYWIEKFNAVTSCEFYNLTSGGFGGNSDYLKEYWNNFSEEERKLCRNWCKRDMNGQNNPMFNRTHSEETKKKIGAKSVNRNWNKPDHHGSKNPRAKKVLVETDEGQKVYACLKDFSNESGLNYATMKCIAKDGRFSKKYNLKITYV